MEINICCFQGQLTLHGEHSYIDSSRAICQKRLKTAEIHNTQDIMVCIAINIHKQYGIYFESQKYLSFLIHTIFSLYQGLNRGPSDPEADDIPMCHSASQ